MKEVTYVIPAPPSLPRKGEVQPVYLLAERIAEYLNVKWSPAILEKISTDQLKGASVDVKREKIAGTIVKRKTAKIEHTMLLVDDLFDSGATLRECVRVLRRDPKIKRIYVLCMTKTKEKS